jgi:pimeloyl-ACP methyl ester carboxylesterase
MKRLFLFSIIFIQSCSVYIGQEVLFEPNKIDDLRDYPLAQEIYIPHENTEEINSVYFNNKSSDKVVLFFHGNGGSIWNRLELIDTFNNIGVDLLMIDYRGYGKNKGEPDIKSLRDYAESAYKYLSKKYKKEDIILYGTALGSIPACHLASKNMGSSLILERAITSTKDLEQAQMDQNFLVKLLINFYIDENMRIDHYNALKNVKTPIFFIHGENDEVTPKRFAMNLFNSIPHTDKKFITVPLAKHSETRNDKFQFVKHVKNFIFRENFSSK